MSDTENEDEHWCASVVAAVEHDRANNPEGWAAYIAEADALSDVDAPLDDELDETRQQLKDRIRRDVAANTSGANLTDELIAERRAEAEREARE